MEDHRGGAEVLHAGVPALHVCQVIWGNGAALQ